MLNRKRTEKNRLATAVSTLLLSVLLFSLMACANLRNVGKSEVDMIADMHLKKIDSFLASLTVSLYEKNPEELEKGQVTSLEIRLNQIIKHPIDVSYLEVDYRKGVDAVTLMLDKNYRGDRVFALMVGISGMLERAYNGHKELFITDRLDAQKLYTSSVNLKRIHGLLNNSELLNLGDVDEQNDFDSTMIRLATIQDIMAEIFANRNHSHINRILHGVTTMLIPIG